MAPKLGGHCDGDLEKGRPPRQVVLRDKDGARHRLNAKTRAEAEDLIAQGHLAPPKKIWDLFRQRRLRNGASPAPAMLMNYSLFLMLQAPCVYCWWRGSDCLYVGSSGHGLRRPFDPNHHQIRKDEILADDCFGFWPCSTITEARWLEAKLIKEFKPLRNLRKEKSPNAAKEMA
jgi:hypothetical protein